MNKLRTSILTLFCLFLLSSFLLAQVPTGKIIGTVTDEEGVPLPGVSVVGTSLRLIGQATFITGSSGVYRLLGLPPGRYTLTFSLSAFKTVIREDILLSVEQTLSVNIQMEIGAIEEEITVIGEAPLIDVKSTTKGMTLKKDVFGTLPKGRNFESLVTIIAGAAHEEDAGGTMIDGATGLENMYYLDGMDITDVLRGYSDQEASFEFIEEVQVKTSGYQAEYGGSLGGVVSVITRSGGNEFHGELIGYYSGSALNGKERDTLRLNPLDQTVAEYVNYQDMYSKDKIQRWEVGFSIGGYILKDKLWFFGSFLPVFRNTTRTVEWFTGEPASSHTEKYTWYNYLAKMTFQPFSGLRLVGTLINNTSTYTGDLPDRDGRGDPAFTYDKVGFNYPNWTGTLSADMVVGKNLFITARGGYFMTDTTNQKIKPPGARYSFTDTNTLYPDLVAMYPEYIRPSGYANYDSDAAMETQKMFYSRTTANVDLTYYFSLSGEHAFKAGFQWVRLASDYDNANAYDLFSFQWDRDYVIHGEEDVVYKGTYGIYEVRYSDPPDRGRYGTVESFRLAFYLQDSWTIADKLTLNFGIRAEQEDVPSYSDLSQYKDKPVMTWDFFDKLAPRFGVVYDVYGDSSLKVFGSFAIYYDVLKLALADGAYGAVRDRYNYYTLDDPRWWTYQSGGPYPGTFINREDGYLPSHEETDFDMKATSQREISFGVEKELVENLSASVRFVRKSLLYAIDDIGIRKPYGTEWWIGNPGYGVTLNEQHGGEFPDKFPDTPKAKREYVGVNITVEKRLSNNWMGGFNYTWSRLRGRFSGLANTQHGQLYPNEISLYDSWYRAFTKDLKPLDGPLWTDRPHFFKLYGSYTFDFGLIVGLTSLARSGVPISRRVNSPSYWYPDGFLTDGRTPFLWTTDLYLEYGLKLGKNKLQLSLNVINLFNAKTAQHVYRTINRIRIIASDDDKLTGTWDYRDYDYVPDPRFLKERAFLDAFSARLGIKFMF